MLALAMIDNTGVTLNNYQLLPIIIYLRLSRPPLSSYKDTR
jgi:hypothetical protein